LADSGRPLQMEQNQVGKTRFAGYSIFVQTSPMS
jgi:hypothetical protein